MDLIHYHNNMSQCLHSIAPKDISISQYTTHLYPYVPALCLISMADIIARDGATYVLRLGGEGGDGQVGVESQYTQHEQEHGQIGPRPREHPTDSGEGGGGRGAEEEGRGGRGAGTLPA